MSTQHQSFFYISSTAGACYKSDGRGKISFVFLLYCPDGIPRECNNLRCFGKHNMNGRKNVHLSSGISGGAHQNTAGAGYQELAGSNAGRLQ